MTSFWSGWIILLTTACLVFVFALLVWNIKNYTHVKEGESMGHTFDDIEEINNPLPKWWTIMFFSTFVWAVIYLAVFPGMGSWEGFGKWTSSNQGIKSLAESRAMTEQKLTDGHHVELDQKTKLANEEFGPVFKKYASMDILDLANVDAGKPGDGAPADAVKAFEEARDEKLKGLKIGQRLFLQNCSQCHGSDARGATGFPNLADSDWLYGGTPAAIKETIMNGRTPQMPAWEAALGEQGVKEMTAFVLSLSGRTVNQKDAEAGQAKFAMCAACHGADGRGSLAHNLPFGAPNLTDTVWLYGGSQRAVEETIRHGRQGVMPAWKEKLGEDKIHLITAYVYSLSNK